MLQLDDVLSLGDVLAIDRQALSLFGDEALASIADKRRVAVYDWIAGELRSHGFDPQRHSVRRAPVSAAAVTSGSVVDITGQMTARDDGPMNLAAYLQTPGTDHLLIGCAEPFRGLAVTMIGSPNTSSLSVASLTCWTGGRWESVSSLTDPTLYPEVGSISFAGGGVMRFETPAEWSPRPLSAPSDPWLYYARLTLTNAPSSPTQVTQMLPVRRSRLTTPAAFYALHLLYLESSKGNRPLYAERADEFRTMASEAFARQVGLLDGEFDTDGDGAVSDTDTVSRNPAVNPFTWERG